MEDCVWSRDWTNSGFERSCCSWSNIYLDIFRSALLHLLSPSLVCKYGKGMSSAHWSPPKFPHFLCIVPTQRRKSLIFSFRVLGVLAGIWIVEEVAFWVRSNRLGWEFYLKIWFLVLGVLVGISIVEEASRNEADKIGGEEILFSSVPGSAQNCRWHFILICLVTYL